MVPRDPSMRIGAHDADSTKFADSYHTAPVGLCDVDRDLRYIRVNEHLAALNGRPAADHIGRAIREVIPDVAPVLEPIFQKVIATGEPVLGVEVRPPSPVDAGIERCWWTTYLPVKTTDGMVREVTAIIADVTTERELKRRLKERIAFETLLTDSSAALVNLPEREVDGEIEAWLRRVVEFLDVDRGTVAQFSPDGRHLRVTHTCALAGVPLFPPVIVEEEFPWFTAGVRRGETIVLSRLPDDLPEEVVLESEYCRRVGFKAELAIPFFAGGDPIGFLSFGSFRHPREWPTDLIPRLRLFGEILASTLVRERAASARKQTDELNHLLFASLRNHVAVLDRDGKIVVANDAWCDFGREGSTCSEDRVGVGANYLDVHARAAGAGSGVSLDALAGIRSVLDGSAESFEMEYDCPGPSGPRCFLMLVSPFKGERGGAVVSHTDITERRRMEGALRESERRFHLMAETAPVMVWMSESKMGRTYFNKRWIEFTGRTPEEETGTGWTEGIHPDDARQYLDRYAEAFDAREEFRAEYRLRRSDGEYRWLLDSGTPRLDQEGGFNGYIGSCIDITEEKLTRENLRNLSAHLIAAHEEERHRIAMELHDDLNQKVALLAVDLDLLGQRPPESPEAFQRQVGELAARIREISSDVHALSHELHPAKLEQLGLAATVRGFCREVSKRDGVRIQFLHRGVPRPIPTDRAVCIYRIVQEALRNIVKHSEATEAEVRLIGNKGAIELLISNPGGGFDPESVHKKGGIGLLNMRERIRLVGGEISFKSSPGRGTCIEARVPLPSPDPRGDDFLDSTPRGSSAT